jgi:hypothetical protein
VTHPDCPPDHRAGITVALAIHDQAAVPGSTPVKEGTMTESEPMRPPAGEPMDPDAAALLAALLEAQEWRFAKTMAHNPHDYTLRKTWADDQAFQAAVRFIRAHGVTERYPCPKRGRKYTVLFLGGWKYWTMGFPLDPDPRTHHSRNTILINRKMVD